MKFGVLSLGCSKNMADMDNFMGIMIGRGHEIVKDALIADLLVIDTCGFIDDAKRESLEEIFKSISFKAKNPGLKVLAVGCLVQRYFEELKSEIIEIDGLIGVTSPMTLADLIEKEEFFYHREPEVVYDYSNRVAGKYSAYVKIGDGCNRDCAFCSIPSFKGRSVSRASESVVKETLSLVKKGVKEVVLVSQDSTQYGRDLNEGLDLKGLLMKLNDLEGDFWIRLLYLHPDHVDDALVDTIISLPKVVDYFDMPVQSGSDKILKRMGRSRNSAELLEMLLGIRQKAPHAILRTTVMVGFPGESEVTFNETLDFVRTVEFDRLGGFVYSREEGTKAFGQRATVGKELATQMLETLMEEQDTISAERLSHFKGKVLTVLLEESGASYTLGRAYNSAPEVDGVVVLKGHNEEGVFLKARITETYEHDMEGVVLDELA